MELLKYRVIKSKKQYNEYCAQLDELLTGKKTKSVSEEIELLTLLIEKWDEEHNSFYDSDPVQVLKSLLTEHNIKSTELAKALGVSKGLISDILNYRKGFSKQVIRKLSDRFKLSNEVFNRHYDLIGSGKRRNKKVILRKPAA